MASLPVNVVVRFTAVKTFESPELGNTYEKGLTYTIRHNNHELRKFAEKWLDENKIAIIDRPTESVSVVIGQAEARAAQPKSRWMRFKERMKAWL
jgi:hypothetical protein